MSRLINTNLGSASLYSGYIHNAQFSVNRSDTAASHSVSLLQLNGNLYGLI